MTKFLMIMVLLFGAISNFTLWECNRCHMQHIGNNPPRNVKCPASKTKQNHWWILKKTNKVNFEY